MKLTQIKFLEPLLSRLKLDKGLERNKVILIILVCAVLVYLDFSFVISLQSKGISVLKPKIAKLEKDIASLYKDLSLMKELKQKGEAAAGAKQEGPATKKIIRQEDIPVLLQDIMDIANKGNVKIEQLRPNKDLKAKEETVSGLKLLPITIDLDLYCGYHNLGKFINEIENAQKFMLVEEIKIDSDNTDYFYQGAKVKIKTYVKK